MDAGKNQFNGVAGKACAVKYRSMSALVRVRWVLGIGQCKCDFRGAMGNNAFLDGMDADRVALVQGRDDADGRVGEGGLLGPSDGGPGVVRVIALDVEVAGEFDNHDGDMAESLAHAMDETGEGLGVFTSEAENGVGLSLIPENAGDGFVLKGGEHGVVEDGGCVGVSQAGGAGRHGGHSLAGGELGARLALPGGDGLVPLRPGAFEGLAVFVEVGEGIGLGEEVQVELIEPLGCGGGGGNGVAWCPGHGGGVADGGLDEGDGGLEAIMECLGEVVGDS